MARLGQVPTGDLQKRRYTSGARSSRAVLRAAHQLENGCGSAIGGTILRGSVEKVTA